MGGFPIHPILGFRVLVLRVAPRFASRDNTTPAKIATADLISWLWASMFSPARLLVPVSNPLSGRTVSIFGTAHPRTIMEPRRVVSLARPFTS